MPNNNSNQKTSSSRTRNYATVVYPESATPNWIEKLNECLVPAFISPLHDQDVNPTGEPKKAHYHVMIMFEGPKTKEQANEIFEQINGVGCVTVNSLRSMARYLCHLDNPDKHQYSKEEVKSLCGADYYESIGLATDKYAALAEMMDFCDKYDVVSFYTLSKYARFHRNDWYRILTDCGSVFMKEYLKSKLWSKEQKCDTIIDPETGENLI